MTVKIAPSILSADFANLASSVQKIEADADWLHIDVMDGHFVPNITIGPPVVKGLRPVSKLFFDCHLMITDPIKFAPEFVEAGADLITFHAEVDAPLEEAVRSIKTLGVKVGVSVKPQTPVEKILPILSDVDVVLVMTVDPGFSGQSFMLDQVLKVTELFELREKEKFGFEIEVDGGIKKENAKLLVDAGADVLVSGSAVFGSDDPAAYIRAMKEATA